jgi:hypothetical protein
MRLVMITVEAVAAALNRSFCHSQIGVATVEMWFGQDVERNVIEEKDEQPHRGRPQEPVG